METITGYEVGFLPESEAVPDLIEVSSESDCQSYEEDI